MAERDHCLYTLVTSQAQPLRPLPGQGDGEATPPLPSHILFFINCFQVGPEVALQRKVEAQENLAGGSVRSKNRKGLGAGHGKFIARKERPASGLH